MKALVRIKAGMLAKALVLLSDLKKISGATGRRGNLHRTL
jgi:hypothetical protein